MLFLILLFSLVLAGPCSASGTALAPTQSSLDLNASVIKVELSACRSTVPRVIIACAQVLDNSTVVAGTTLSVCYGGDCTHASQQIAPKGTAMLKFVPPSTWKQGLLGVNVMFPASSTKAPPAFVAAFATFAINTKLPVDGALICKGGSATTAFLKKKKAAKDVPEVVESDKPLVIPAAVKKTGGGVQFIPGAFEAFYANVSAMESGYLTSTGWAYMVGGLSTKANFFADLKSFAVSVEAVGRPTLAGWRYKACANVVSLNGTRPLYACGDPRPFADGVQLNAFIARPLFPATLPATWAADDLVSTLVMFAPPEAQRVQWRSLNRIVFGRAWSSLY